MRVTTFLKTEIGASLYGSPPMSMGPCIIVLALGSDGGSDLNTGVNPLNDHFVCVWKRTHSRNFDD